MTEHTLYSICLINLSAFCTDSLSSVMEDRECVCVCVCVCVFLGQGVCVCVCVCVCFYNPIA